MKRSAMIFSLGLLAFFAASGSTEVRAQSIDDNRGGAIELSDSPSSGGRTSQQRRGGFQPEVGRKAAEKYMRPRRTASTSSDQEGAVEVTGGDRVRSTESVSANGGTHYLALHVGSFVSDNTYRWGGETDKDNGRFNMGVTYRVGEWVNSMDLGIRIDFTNYKLQEGRANKLSFLPVIIFPDANSNFPLYFGAGLGLGVFVNQLKNESPLALDYQVFAGIRFMNIFEGVGLFVEGGMKNHLLLLSDGQFNGTFVTVGSVFSF